MLGSCEPHQLLVGLLACGGLREVERRGGRGCSVADVEALRVLRQRLLDCLDRAWREVLDFVESRKDPVGAAADVLQARVVDAINDTIPLGIRRLPPVCQDLSGAVRAGVRLVDVLSELLESLLGGEFSRALASPEGTGAWVRQLATCLSLARVMARLEVWLGHTGRQLQSCLRTCHVLLKGDHRGDPLLAGLQHHLRAHKCEAAHALDRLARAHRELTSAAAKARVSIKLLGALHGAMTLARTLKDRTEEKWEQACLMLDEILDWVFTGVAAFAAGISPGMPPLPPELQPRDKLEGLVTNLPYQASQKLLGFLQLLLPGTAELWWLVPPSLATPRWLMDQRADGTCRPYDPPLQHSGGGSSGGDSSSSGRPYHPGGLRRQHLWGEVLVKEEEVVPGTPWPVCSYRAACDDVLAPPAEAAVAAACAALYELQDTSQQLRHALQACMSLPASPSPEAELLLAVLRSGGSVVQLQAQQLFNAVGACATQAQQLPQEPNPCRLWLWAVGRDWRRAPGNTRWPLPPGSASSCDSDGDWDGPGSVCSAGGSDGGDGDGGSDGGDGDGDGGSDEESDSSSEAGQRTWSEAYRWGCARCWQPQQEKVMFHQQQRARLLWQLQQEAAAAQRRGARAAAAAVAAQPAEQQARGGPGPAPSPAGSSGTGSSARTAAAAGASLQPGALQLLHLRLTCDWAGCDAGPSGGRDAQALLQHLGLGSSLKPLAGDPQAAAWQLHTAEAAARRLQRSWQPVTCSSSSSSSSPGSSTTTTTSTTSRSSAIVSLVVKAALFGDPEGLGVAGGGSIRGLMWELLQALKPNAALWYRIAAAHHKDRQQQQQGGQPHKGDGAGSSSSSNSKCSSISGAAATARKARKPAPDSCGERRSSTGGSGHTPGTTVVAAALGAAVADVPESCCEQLWRVMGGSIASDLLLVPPRIRDLLSNGWAAGAGRLAPSSGSGGSLPDGSSAAGRMLVVQYARAARQQFAQAYHPGQLVGWLLQLQLLADDPSDQLVELQPESLEHIADALVACSTAADAGAAPLMGAALQRVGTQPAGTAHVAGGSTSGGSSTSIGSSCPPSVFHVAAQAGRHLAPPHLSLPWLQLLSVYHALLHNLPEQHMAAGLEEAAIEVVHDHPCPAAAAADAWPLLDFTSEPVAQLAAMAVALGSYSVPVDSNFKLLQGQVSELFERCSGVLPTLASPVSTPVDAALMAQHTRTYQQQQHQQGTAALADGVFACAHWLHADRLMEVAPQQWQQHLAQQQQQRRQQQQQRGQAACVPAGGPGMRRVRGRAAARTCASAALRPPGAAARGTHPLGLPRLQGGAVLQPGVCGSWQQGARPQLLAHCRARSQREVLDEWAGGRGQQQQPLILCLP